MRNCSMSEYFKVWWMSFKAGFQLAYGVYRISKLKYPVIGIFGGTAAYENGKYFILAEAFAKKCAENGMSVITGGGPGIMKAANCSAYEVDGKKASLGIGVEGVDEDFKEECIPLVTVDYFFARKWLLTRYAQSFVFFPGGIGTMDEFFEVLNLVKLHKMEKAPVVLIGCDYWKGITQWYQHAFDYEFITAAPQSSFVITDDIDEAFNVIRNKRDETLKKIKSKE